MRPIITVRYRSLLNGLIALVCLLSVTRGPAAAQPQPVYPIVDLPTGLLLGGASGGKWLAASEVGARLRGREQYRLYGLFGAVGTAVGTKARSAGVPCEDAQVVTLSSQPEAAQIGLSAPWRAMPRVPVAISNNSEVYRRAVAQVLQQNGIAKPQVRLTRVVRIDLEGDGVDEVLVSATRWAGGNLTPSAAAGDYSLVMMRKVVKGKVETTVLDGNFFPKAAQFAAPNEFTIATLLDLNGDGILEIVIDSQYYEGASTVMYRMVGKDARATLETGCGA